MVCVSGFPPVSNPRLTTRQNTQASPPSAKERGQDQELTIQVLGRSDYNL